MIARLKRWARAIRRDLHAPWLAARDPRTPWVARALAVVIAAYALSPIDLIPDVIQLLRLLDEAILLPIAMLVVIRLVPPAVMADCRARAEDAVARPVSRAGAAFIVAVWLALPGAAAWWLVVR